MVVPSTTQMPPNEMLLARSSVTVPMDRSILPAWMKGIRLGAVVSTISRLTLSAFAISAAMSGTNPTI